MDHDVIAYPVLSGLIVWAKVFFACLGIVAVVSLVFSIANNGFGEGFRIWLRGIANGVVDFAHTSFRRVWAIAMLTIREAIRRKALVVFVIFAVLFMFAGWFLPESASKPDMLVKVNVSFVLKTILWLILPVMLLLACWGIPEDIRLRSMHTVVTKPVRRSEIVMGRILGFTAVGTMIVGVMSGVGYLWLYRQIPQDVRKQELICRVPVFATLSFLNREGNPSNKGVNTGDVWDFRSFIEGATKSAAIWDFQGIGPEALVPVEDSTTGEIGPGLLLEVRFESFRSHKGVIGKGLLAQLRLSNPEGTIRPTIPPIEVAEFRGNLVAIPRKISYFDDGAKATKTVDLLDDLVGPKGELRIETQCLNSGQYLGMARPDLFIRTPDRHFAVGYFKAVMGIWLMMALMTMIGVTTSCFVKGPVATLCTFMMLAVGHWMRELMEKIVSGEQQGGGPLESVYRMVMHLNQVTELDPAWWVKPVKFLDRAAIEFLWLCKQVIPNFDYFDMDGYVANGFDVNFGAAMVPSLLITAGFVLPCLLIGYYSLRLRELEAK